jgi:hypothetical protein
MHAQEGVNVKTKSRIFLGLLMLSVGAGCQMEQRDLLDFLTRGIEYHNSLMSNIFCEYELRFGDTGVLKAEWCYDGTREGVARKMYEGDKLIMDDRATFDTKVGRTLNYDVDGDYKQPSGKITPRLPTIMRMMCPIRLWSRIYEDKHLGELLRNGKAKVEPEKEVVGEDECYVVAGQGDEEYYSYRVWVSPQKDFRLVRIEFYAYGKISSVVHSIKLEKIKGRWIPVYAKHGSPENPNANEIFITNVQVGAADKHEDLLTIEYPPKTGIWDAIANKGYFTPDTGTE